MSVLIDRMNGLNRERQMFSLIQVTDERSYAAGDMAALFAGQRAVC